MDIHIKNFKKYLIKTFIWIFLIMSILTQQIYNITMYVIESSNSDSVLIITFISWLLGISLVYLLFITLFTKKVSKRASELAQKYNEEKSILFSNIVHDLKTPMTTTMGFSRALKDNMVVDENEKQELIHSIYEKTLHANQLLDRMFQYSKLDSIDFKLKKENYDIARLLRECIAEYYEEFEMKNIELNLSIPENEIILSIDPLEMKRAISNIIINCFKHNIEGSKILISLTKEDVVKIIIADNGKAIPDDLKETLFQAFICGDVSRNSQGGSGLGLAIVKKIMEKHNGKVWLEDNYENYTKAFIITI